MQADEHPERLPEPDPASAEHSLKVAVHLREQIAEAGGTLSFAEFMQEALYAPGLGYYAAGATKFGAAGDFVTAPEVSPLFGRVIARQCAEVLDLTAGGAILELGAGTGRLAVDVLGRLKGIDALPEEYRILEVSPELSARQAETIKAEIPELLDRVRWLDALPDSHRGVVIANEILDALPVERFVRRESVRQLRVADRDGKLCFVEADAPPVLQEAVFAIEDDLSRALERGYTSEVSLGTGPWVADVVAALEKGAILLFDYGLPRREHYAPDRHDGWLRCHFRHRAHNDPLILPGIQDITAWVDFTSVATAAVDNGAEIAGFVTQAAFLMNAGLDAEMAFPTDAPLEQQIALSEQVKMLTLPGSMGEAFKCLGLSKGIDGPLTAFSHADRTHTL
ncbi:MAG: SAM-dependent methyltransferase [Woeseiaceae bacterium]|nr:SAM-dependent methyltransferase [Woeseiaceae bacterium]